MNKSKQVWVKPELLEIDISETAFGGSSGNDGNDMENSNPNMGGGETTSGGGGGS